MTNKLQQLNDELANCRKAISQAVVLSDQSMALRKIENNIISDIQKTEKIIENRGWQTKSFWYNKSITNNT